MKRHIAKTPIVLFLILWSINISAQNKYTITGTVIDCHEAPISYASVVLSDNSKILAGCVTDDKGRFSLQVNSSVNELELSIEFIGYMKKVMSISPIGRNMNIGDIILEDDTRILEEAVVTARTEARKSSLERTTFGTQTI